jgi:hypothetical protein
MRKPNEDDLSEDVADTGSVGDGFSAVVDFSDPYGSSFDDDYMSEEDESFGEESTDESFDDELSDDADLDVDEPSFGADLSESEAEDILEDMLEESYGSNADEAVESLEESSGMSAIEILEDITGQELGDSERDSDSDALDPTSDGMGTHDLDESSSLFDLDVAD